MNRTVKVFLGILLWLMCVPLLAAPAVRDLTRIDVAQPDAAPPKRVALIIGNKMYRHASTLTNPINDAEDVAAALERLGFDKVILRTDRNKKQMIDDIQEFSDALTENGIGVFYYSGHGGQLAGVNYLIPTDAELKRESLLEFEGVDAGRVLGAMKEKRTAINMVILDACRNNPFPGGSRSGAGKGLARMDAPRGTLIAYATRPGEVAEDGVGRNGTFTKHLLNYIAVPGLEAQVMFRRVREGVEAETRNTQTPWDEGGYTGDFYFTGPPSSSPSPSAAPPTSPSQPSISREDIFWQSIMASVNAADFEDYLRRFPGGAYVSLARQRLDNFRSTVLAETAPPDSVAFYFTQPAGAMLQIGGKSLRVGANLRLYLKAGSNRFSLRTESGDELFGDLEVLLLDEITKQATFGRNTELPKPRHIAAALQGSPVTYAVRMNVAGSDREVIRYKLGLRAW